MTKDKKYALITEALTRLENVQDANEFGPHTPDISGESQSDLLEAVNRLSKILAAREVDRPLTLAADRMWA